MIATPFDIIVIDLPVARIIFINVGVTDLNIMIMTKRIEKPRLRGSR